MRILLLSAYDARSHKYWRESLVAEFPKHSWTQLVLPGRYFSWRIRGNSMQWALGERAILDQPYDLIIATSMVDLASLKGFVPNLANIQSVLFFHENQFAYPASLANEKHHLDPKMVTLYAAIAANKLVFNSQYNQQSFIRGVKQLLCQLPEKMPVDLAQLLDEKSSILPVPLKLLSGFDNEHYPSVNGITNSKAQQDLTLWPARYGSKSLRIVWAARWEYDKGPQQLLAILREMRTRGMDFKLCILGQAFRQQPPEFESIKTEFSAQLVQFGYAETRWQYLSWLAGADMMLSTALHEFQGLAVLEAAQLGCVPVLPERLVYPQMFGLDYVYPSSPDAPALEAIAAVNLIQKLALKRPANIDIMAYVEPLTWPNMRPKYQQLINSVGHSGPS